MECDSRGGDHSFRGGKVDSPSLLGGYGFTVSNENASDCPGLNFRQMFLDPDETRDTKGTEVAEVGSAAKAHFERRHIVGISGRGQAVADVGGGNDSFTPEARRE